MDTQWDLSYRISKFHPQLMTFNLHFSMFFLRVHSIGRPHLAKITDSCLNWSGLSSPTTSWEVLQVFSSSSRSSSSGSQVPPGPRRFATGSGPRPLRSLGGRTSDECCASAGSVEGAEMGQDRSRSKSWSDMEPT